jgi:hypothetical protein
MRFSVGMKWLLLFLAVVLFVGWMVAHVGLGIASGVMNMLWMCAILIVILWGVARFT